MNISVIIPTYNRPDKLRSLLEDLVVTDHPRVKEVIVCDDGSSMDNESLVNSISSTIPIRYLRQPDMGFRAGQARNMGIRSAQGDILLFLDDDVKISGHFIDAHIAKHEALGGRSLVFGFRYRTPHEQESILSLKQPRQGWKTDSRADAIGLDGSGLAGSSRPWFYVYSCNFSVSNTPDLPLFDATFDGWGMEDIEYAYRLHYLGYAIHFEKDAWLLHIESVKPRDPFRCEELDVERNYDSYVKNCIRFLQKYPNDQELNEIISNDLRWYVQNEHGSWVKNGMCNDFSQVLDTYPHGVPVRAEIAGEIATGFDHQAMEEAFMPLPDSSLLTRKMDEIAIELTTYCNLKCAMCSVWEIKQTGINTARAKEILTEAYSLGARTFIPCGAESFMRKDFLEIVEFADNLGFTQQEIVTNGLLLNDQHFQRLKAIPSVTLHISIDGPEHIHDSLRGKGNYKKILQILRQLKEHNIRFGISSVIMRETLPFLSHIIDLAVDLELDEISMQPFQFEIAGPNKDLKRFSFLKNQSSYLVYELGRLYKMAKAKNIRLFTESLFYTIPDYLIHHKRPIPPKGCHMPSRFLLVDYKGSVYPCFFMRNEPMGNVNTDSLKQVWHSAAHNKMQKLALGKECPGCLAACSDIASYNELQLQPTNHA